MRIYELVFIGLASFLALPGAELKSHAGAGAGTPHPGRLTGEIMLRLVLLSLLAYRPAGAGDSNPSDQERTQALNWLEQSHREFRSSIDGVSEAQWNWKPAPDRWSVGETAEHIVLAEAALFRFAERAVADPPNAAWAEQTRCKTDLLIQVMPSREAKAKSPEPLAPRQALTREQVTERFETQRAAIARFAAEPRLALKEHTAPHPFPVFGILNAYQWLIAVPLHTFRHNQQIAEVKATRGYPANQDGAERNAARV